ncbi:hypothetical protein BDN67DRAFT_867090, partial [Paxillus ammoniavirescens]
IPKLDAAGKNWSIWKFRVELNLGTKGLMEHVYGTKLEPTNPASSHSPAWIPTTPAEIQAQEDYKREPTEWEKNDHIAHQQICWTIPNSLIHHLMQKSTAVEHYKTLKELFKGRSFIVTLE